jgi:hypothetical protein
MREDFVERCHQSETERREALDALAAPLTTSIDLTRDATAKRRYPILQPPRSVQLVSPNDGFAVVSGELTVVPATLAVR